MIAKYLFRYGFLQRVKESDRIFLTFDDGPEAAITPKILELLERYDVRATFFPAGENMAQNPELVRQIIKGGHEIGEHGYYHIHPWKSGPLKTIQDINKTREVFRSLGEGERTKLCRPPYGKLNLVQLLYWLRLRQQMVFWTLDPRDYKGHSGEQVGRYVMDHLVPGSVVLLHDSRRNPDSDGMVTVEALRLILHESQDRQIKFSTISEMLGESESEHTFTLDNNV